MIDYAGACSSERGHCFRYVYDEHGKPVLCPEPLVSTGWLQLGQRWHAVDACAEHAAQLHRHPGRPASDR